MPSIAKSGITELLTAWNNGDRSALEKLAPLILEDLRRIGGHRLLDIGEVRLMPGVPQRVVEAMTRGEPIRGLV